MASLLPAGKVRPGSWIEVERPAGFWSWVQVGDVRLLAGGKLILSLSDGCELELRQDEEVVWSAGDPAGVRNRKAVPEWADYFLAIAAVVATRAKCRRRQVGAVLVDPQNRIIGTGYAGFPRGTKRDCMSGGCPRGLAGPTEVPPYTPYENPGTPGYCPSIHAEVNAISYASREVRGSTVYVTDKPCSGCMKSLASAGVALAVWPGGSFVPLDLYDGAEW